MGRLIDPGVGELSDRLTILCLKILHGSAAGKVVEHFQKEKTAILIKLRTREVNGKWFEAYSDLAAVNGALWEAEDDLRVERGRGVEANDFAVVHLAFRIQELNDLRAALVQQINKDAGDELGTEKVK